MTGVPFMMMMFILYLHAVSGYWRNAVSAWGDSKARRGDGEYMYVRLDEEAR